MLNLAPMNADDRGTLCARGQPQAKGPSEPRWAVPACGVALAAAALAAYAGTFSVPMLYDDGPAILDNPTLRHFASALWPPAARTVTGRPVLNLSLALNYAVSGASVWSYHALNLAIHALAGLTLFGIVRRTLLGRRDLPGTALGFSAALLWTLHPLQTGAVTYIVQRAESLMGLFYLLTLYGFVRGAAAGPRARRLWHVVCVGSCVLGMATKEVMASAPLIVLLYDRAFVAGSFREAWARRRSLYACLAATWAVPAALVLLRHAPAAASWPSAAPPWWHYALTQFPAITHYLRLCFLPHPLVFDYGTALAPLSPRILPSILAVAGLLAATAWALVRRPAAGLLGAGFFAILAPSSSIVPVAGETMADYRMYLPLIPVVVLVLAGLFRWLGRAALPVCLVLAAGLGAATAARNRDYASALSIWSDTVAKRPGNYRARNNLGGVLLGVPGRLGDAIVQFEEAVRLRPDLAEGHNNLANALSMEGGRAQEAVAQYREALRIDPGLNAAYIGLGNAYADMPGQLDQAIGCYEEGLRLNPDSSQGHFDLGNALARAPGRLADAVAQYEEALRLNPEAATAHFALAVALLRIPGRTRDAVAHLEAGLRLKPDDALARRILADVRASGK